MSSTEAPSAFGPTTDEAEQRKIRFFVLFAGVVVALDVITKFIAERTLPPYQPIPILGDVFRLTFIYNRGAAFGLTLGEHSRWIFLALTLMALVLLWLWLRGTHPADRFRLVAISSITGGAIGNLIDRVRHHRGVVDFLDVGLGNTRWPVFNIADIAVTCGAIALAISLWREEQAAGEEP